jgi:hypothetical protein
MKKVLLILSLLVSGHSFAQTNMPRITEQEYEITPRKWETCYQYAERKVGQMIRKHWPNRIIGSIWLSEFWAHHYYGAIEYRNYTWQAV